MSIVDISGVWPVYSQFDAVGGITNSVIDFAVLATSLIDPDATKLPYFRRFREISLAKIFKDSKSGFLDPYVWRLLPDLAQSIDEIDRQIPSAVLQYPYLPDF